MPSVYPLLHEEVGFIGRVKVGVRNFKPGDLSGMHSDNVEGRKGGLSLTAYFNDPESGWNATSAGGLAARALRFPARSAVSAGSCASALHLSSR